MLLGLDIETFSAAEIRNGAWAYSQHPSTGVFVVVFSFADGTAAAGDYDYIRWAPGDEIPAQVVDYIRSGGAVLAHNDAFEKAIWANVLEPLGWPQIALDQWRDSQAVGLAANLPMALGGLAAALGCKVQKDDEGAKLMKRMCVAVDDNAGGWTTNENDTAENRERLAVYCERDVGAMLDVWFRLPVLSPMEAAILRADRAVNTRGIFIDQAFAARMAELAAERKQALDLETFSMTAGELANSRSTPALKSWLVEHGVELPTTTKKQRDGAFRKVATADKAAVAEMLSRDDLPAEVQAVLSNRIESNKVTSLAKLARVASMVGADGRLYNALQYNGAHTARWTSHGLQVHNLPKPMGAGAQSLADHLIAGGYDLETVGMFFDRPLDMLSKSLRSLIVAPPGRDLIAADWSAIEARVVAWLAGQHDVLDLFAQGTCVYTHAAKNVGSDNRQLGKVCVLALGYGMGVLTFVDTAAKWGIPITLKDGRRIQQAWRGANAAIVQFWRDLEDAVRDAIHNPGEVFRASRISCLSNGKCLFVRLPSGRSIRYWRPKIVTATRTIKMVDEGGAVVEREMTTDEIRFWTMGANKSSMAQESTYGGKLVENVTQAVARDMLGEALVRLEDVEPYDVVVHVHDSVAAEVPTGTGDVEEFCRLLEVPPKWAYGLPIAAAGYRSRRFQG